MPNVSRGIRNNNPGNIDRNNIAWQGLAADQSSDPRFCVFESAHYGIRALARVLRVYSRRHGISSVRGAIERWAPPVENNTGSYVAHAAASCGVGPDDVFNLDNDENLMLLIPVIIQHENGEQPYHLTDIAKAVIASE